MAWLHIVFASLVKIYFMDSERMGMLLDGLKDIGAGRLRGNGNIRLKVYAFCS